VAGPARISTTGSIGFLVDTNVLVYMYDNRDGAKRSRAIAVVRYLRQRRVGSLSAQVLGEFFNSVTRRLPVPLTHARAERSVILLSRSWTVFAITPLTVIEAVRGVQRYQMSYWDALIWATAKLNGVPTVLSEDFNDGVLLENVRFRNPFAAGFDITSL
jgi:predicted nucleic acid-binding protein